MSKYKHCSRMDLFRGTCENTILIEIVVLNLAMNESDT
jgi:hypothetical protein